MIPFDDLARDHPPLAAGFRTLDAYLGAHPEITELRISDIREHCGQSVSFAELCVAIIVLEERGYAKERFEVLNPATWKAAPGTFADLRDIPDTLTDASGVEFDTDKGHVDSVYVLTEKAKIAATA